MGKKMISMHIMVRKDYFEGTCIYLKLICPKLSSVRQWRPLPNYLSILCCKTPESALPKGRHIQGEKLVTNNSEEFILTCCTAKKFLRL